MTLAEIRSIKKEGKFWETTIGTRTLLNESDTLDKIEKELLEALKHIKGLNKT
mgnify:CR=1 FL=1